MTSAYHNPVRVVAGRGSLDHLPELVADREALLITSDGAVTRGTVRRIEGLLGTRLAHIEASVEPNPTIESVTRCFREIENAEFDLVVALGGGSTIDTAKAVALLADGQVSPDWIDNHLRKRAPKPCILFAAPIIAIPTTSGTGSEVTQWATIWDERSGDKHSLADRCLYPECALLDPELTETLPLDVTLFSALDALSHACESVWNINANPVSDALAVQAGTALFSILDDSFSETYTSSAARDSLQTASLLAGLAFSNTGTALAHSISYALTGRLGVPHGAACSFALPEVLRFNAEIGPSRLAPILSFLHSHSADEAVDQLYGLFSEIGLRGYLSRWISGAADIDTLDLPLIAPARASNNIRPATELQAAHIVRSALLALGIQTAT
jgi:phosphonate metabolism-associated iron-containing alcohol dehydrogenase